MKSLLHGRISGAVSFAVFEIRCERSQPIPAVCLPAGLLVPALGPCCCTRHLAVIPRSRPLPHNLSTVSCPAVLEAAEHGKKRQKPKIRRPKTRLGLPDLDQSKAAVIGSLRSPESQGGYRHAINEFIEWYCSEPRLSFNRTVVLRYRIHLESRNLASGTTNVRLAAVRRLAYEAADAGLLKG